MKRKAEVERSWWDFCNVCVDFLCVSVWCKGCLRGGGVGRVKDVVWGWCGFGRCGVGVVWCWVVWCWEAWCWGGVVYGSNR